MSEHHGHRSVEAGHSRPVRRARAELVAGLADEHGGVLHRRALRLLDVDRHDVRTEVAAGRWSLAGRQTVAVGTGPLTETGRWWQAVWESGAQARLDGAAALLAHGLRGFTPETIDVSVPHHRSSWTHLGGVRVARRRRLPPAFPTGVPRARVEWATIRAAQLARSDRQAALLICLPVQQLLLAPARLLATWQQIDYSARRTLLDQVIRDVCDGTQSLGELDFARLCRASGLPAPDRQVVRTTARGRVYLDCHWDDVRLTVEIDGGHHGLALNPIDDALRQNELSLGRELVLRVPVLGLRLHPEAFLRQVRAARRVLAGRAA